MSYCRFSSMDWQCDVYVYEDCHGGWTTYVAGRRRIGVMRNPYPLRQGFLHRYLVTHQVQMDTMEDCPWLDLSEVGEEAGEDFNDPTPGECADRLEALAAKGFNVPDYAIAALREEEAEQ